MKNKFIKLSVLALFLSVFSISVLTACDDEINIKTETVTAVVTEKEYTPRSTRYVGVVGKGGHCRHIPEKFEVKVEYKDCYHWFDDEQLYDACSVGDEISVKCQIETLNDGRIVFEIIEWEE